MLAKFMSTVLGRGDVLDNLTHLLIKSAIGAIENERSHESLVTFLLSVIANS